MSVTSEWVDEVRDFYEQSSKVVPWPSFVEAHAFALLGQADALLAEAHPDDPSAAQRMVEVIDRNLYMPPLFLTTCFGYGLDEYHRRLAELRAMPYRDYLQTREWRLTKAIVRRRFGGRCATCNSAKRLHVHVHHRTYERRGEEDIGDLTLLCGDCHGLFHAHRKLAR